MQVFTKNKSCQASIVFDLFLIGPTHVASQVVLVVKKLPANTEDIRDVGFLPGLGRSPGGGHGNLSSIFAWRIPMDRGASWASVHRVAKSWTRLSD